MNAPLRVLADRYELHRKLARGGMADVFLARDRVLDRPVAVKVLFPEFATDPAFAERFRREAQSAANLQHPNVVGVYDFGSEAGTYFIVMEYIDGPSIAEVLKREGAFTPARAVAVIDEVAEGLGFAHSRGMIHRDVKPGNILLTSGGRAKIADFGIARAVHAPDSGLTQVGSVVGTAAYFAPEQAQGFPLDARSDLYSLGAVLFEMTTGQPPFRAETPIALAYKHVQERPPRPAALRPGLPLGLEAVTLKLLAKNPANRYASAADLSGDLRRFLNGQTTLAEQALGVAPGGPTAMDATQVGGSPVTAAFGEGATGAPTMVGSTVGMAPTGAATALQTSVVNTVGADQAPVEDAVGRNGRTGLFLGILVLMLAALGGLTLWAWDVLQKDTKNDVVEVKVPQVVGRTKQEALLLLAQAKLKGEVAMVANDLVPADQVIAQDPSPGSKVARDTTVTIQVSLGPGSKKVPDVSGLTVDAAKEALKNAGFQKVNAESVETDQHPEGLVFEQDPAKDTLYDPTQTIIIRVAAPFGSVTVPSVRGLTEQAARDKVEGAGFTVAAVTEEASSSIEAGRAIRTEPSGDVQKGSAITIVVSSGPQRVTVPNVIGLVDSAAVSKLEGAGFKVSKVYDDLPAGDSSDGRVTACDPGVGTDAAMGATVTISVGRAAVVVTTRPPSTTQTTPNQATTTTPPNPTTTETPTTTAPAVTTTSAP